MPSQHLNPIARFHRLASNLKHLRRQGWLDRGVDDPESTASHCWSVALLAWMLARDRPDLDRNRVLLLGLIHDLPEALAGDATPFDTERDPDGYIPPEQLRATPTYTDEARDAKQQRETEALQQLLSDLDPALARDIHDAWREYEAAGTPEAQFVKQVDKLETLLQAETYRADQPKIIIDSFRLGAHRDVTDPQLRAIINDEPQ